jgi:2-oxoisovalerate dehydrogenase E1 component
MTKKTNLKLMNQPQPEIISDYQLAQLSRQASLIGRKEVLTGKAKFGIFGDGKEVAQIALAKCFQKGDWRSGYYRDQTMMLALETLTITQFFAQLYADTDPDREPCSAGRQMNSHFATRFVNDAGKWSDQTSTYNSSADASPTASQMARLLGLAYASKMYRGLSSMKRAEGFSRSGQEVAFGTIGNASTAEGIFWETLNAAGVLQVPMALSVWDDGYGISVPNKYQMTKESISEIVEGFASKKDGVGIDIYVVPGWDYLKLVEAYRNGVEKVRKTHKPALFHITELTQPQGHSTSGSHERYKSKSRMAFEKDNDCLVKMREWILAEGHADRQFLDQIEKQAEEEVKRCKEDAWRNFQEPIQQKRQELLKVLGDCENTLESGANRDDFHQLAAELERAPNLNKRTVMSYARKASFLGVLGGGTTETLAAFMRKYDYENRAVYSRYLYSESDNSPLNVALVPPQYDDKCEELPGHDVINRYFHEVFSNNDKVFAIGEDIGFLGGVNQGFKEIQEKFGELRITDTGIREATILGQGIGAAMRGLRPIVDIQYLDYLLYCFQTLADDLATLHYRSAGGQLAPVIIRTRGHRLEGIWHTGSPMGMILGGCRGVHVCVPRNFVQASGMYNTLLGGDDPGIVIEVLVGYRYRERVPHNLGEFNVPLGVPEVLIKGDDLTLVTYGACVRIAEEAVTFLKKAGISVELIDVQTLLPFDIQHIIGASVEKTNALICLDEDVPGGASAFMLQQVLEKQKAYECLDAPPVTLSAQAHRAAYGSDGDYWSKPNQDDIVEAVYSLMRERDPQRFPRDLHNS